MTQNGIKSTNTAFDIIETMREANGMTITELSKELDLSTSTVHGHLVTLVERGYVVKRNGSYHAGVRFLDLGAHARRNISGYHIIKPRIEWLASETNERAQFMVAENGQGVYVYVSRGDRSVPSHTEIGKIRHLNTCAAGKAILANYPRSRVEQLIERWGLKARTENTITDRERLLQELETIRERGYAMNKEESAKGLQAIGAVVRRPDGSTLGAISLSGPVHRMNGERIDEELPNKLLGTVEEIELNTEFA